MLLGHIIVSALTLHGEFDLRGSTLISTAASAGSWSVLSFRLTLIPRWLKTVCLKPGVGDSPQHRY